MRPRGRRPVSWSACLQAIIPAPVWSRSSLTRLALIVVLTAAHRSSAAAVSAAGASAAAGSARSRLAPRRPAAASPRARRLGAPRLVRGRLGRRALGGHLGLAHLRLRRGDRRRRSRGRRASTSGSRRRCPGTTYVTSSGSQFVSTSAITGSPSRCASRSASCSLRRSTMKTASGWRFIAETPPRFDSSFSSSTAHRDALLGGQQVELALLLQAAQLLEVGDPVGDRAPVGEQAAEPAVRDVRHADARRLADDRVLGLLLRADEEDRAAALGDVAREVVSLLQQRLRLLEVDDVDAAALVEDEALHLRVPAARLVAEVHAGLQQLLHGDDCHGCPFGWLGAAPAGADGTGLRRPGTPVRRRRRGGGLDGGIVASLARRSHAPARAPRSSSASRGRRQRRARDRAPRP